jgi:hypothetical protein
MKIKIDDRIRVVKGIHIGKIGMVKSINNTVVGVYPNQKYFKTFNVMDKYGTLISVDANDVEVIKR